MNALRVEIKRLLLNRSLRLFERKLEIGNVSPDKVEMLFQRLSLISSGYKQLERVCPFARPDISADLDHIVTLYGRIITLNQEHEIKAIAKKAEELDKKITQTPCTTLAHEVDALKDHIYSFCRDNRPSKEGRVVLSHARKSAKRADSVIKNEDPAVAKSPLEDETEEVAEDLFEIAYLYFAGKPQEATRGFNALSQAVKTRCYEHLKEIGGNPFDLQMHAIKWQQSLIRAGFEITEADKGDRFLNQSEIDAFFQERHGLESSSLS